MVKRKSLATKREDAGLEPKPPTRRRAIKPEIVDRVRAQANSAVDTTDLPATNIAFHADLEQHLATILSHDLFTDIVTRDALSLKPKRGEKSIPGYQAGFDTASFEAAMQSRKLYQCGYNAMSCNLFWSPTPGVPINPGAIQRLKRHFFARARYDFPETVVVALRTGENPTTLHGSLRLVSPPGGHIRAVGQDCRRHRARGHR